MPKPMRITKAFLQEITWNKDGMVASEGRKLDVQFNPETLKVAFSNQIAGDNNNGGSAIQFASRGTTKLSFDLWFDVTARQPDGAPPRDDVRKFTKEVADFMKTTKGTGKDAKFTPPGCRFQWGTFLFEGVVESINENLEFFSEQGKPLRASVAVSLVKQDVEVTFAPSGPAGAAGTQPQQKAQTGDSVQAMSAREGRPEEWQERARQNGVEDPLRMKSGSSLPSTGNGGFRPVG
jgi:hypothetical protein